jgi:hypothetical protein
MSFKEWWSKFKIFLWYIVTEPLRQARDVGRLIGKALNLLDGTLAWAYFALTLLIISLVVGKKLAAALFILLLLLVIFAHEWKTGYFMHRYRQETIRKLKKKEKTLNEAHGGDYKEGDNWSEDKKE